VGLNRALESAILKLWGGFTPLAQPTMCREREREKEEEKKETESKNDQDGRKRPSLRRTDPRRACRYSSSVSAKIAIKKSPKIHALASASVCTLVQRELFLVLAGTVGDPATTIIYRSDHPLGTVTSRMSSPCSSFQEYSPIIAPGSRT